MKRIYTALIRSTLDYGCIVYGTAGKTMLSGLDRIQTKALCLCCGAFKTSPVASLQVEVGEMPLRIRRLKLKLAYWTNLKGHNIIHPTKKVLKECWEYNHTDSCSFGWSVEKEAKKMGIDNVTCCKTINVTAIPPWLFISPVVNMEIKEVGKINDIYQSIQQYIEFRYEDSIQIYTDASKDPSTGKTGAAVFIPKHNINIQKRTSDQLSVFSTEMMAIIIALQWVKEVK